MEKSRSKEGSKVKKRRSKKEGSKVKETGQNSKRMGEWTQSQWRKEGRVEGRGAKGRRWRDGGGLKARRTEGRDAVITTELKPGEGSGYCRGGTTD